jgi:hypothetical protein
VAGAGNLKFVADYFRAETAAVYSASGSLITMYDNSRWVLNFCSNAALYFLNAAIELI